MIYCPSKMNYLVNFCFILIVSIIFFTVFFVISISKENIREVLIHKLLISINFYDFNFFTCLIYQISDLLFSNDWKI